MVDQWIDEALPGQPPSPEFVARLRDDLSGEWRYDGATVTTVVGATPRPRRALPWVVALTAAAASLVAIVVRSDPGTRVQNTPVTSTTVDESSISSTTIVLTGAALLETLSAHRWVQQPFTPMDLVPSAQWIEFDPTGQVLTWFDGCGSRTFPVTLVDQSVRVTGAAPLLPCGDRLLPNPIVSSSLEFSQVAGVLHLTLVPTDPQQPSHTYVAMDTFGSVAGSDLVGDWKVPTGGTLHLAADGTTGVGFCTDLGTWRFEGGQLSMSGLDETRTIACSGGHTSSWLSQIENTTLTAHSGSYLVLDHGDTVFALSRSSLDRVNDVWDLAAGTVYGFGLPTVAPVEFVAGVVSGQRGQPTFDSGWYTRSSARNVEGAACRSGQPARVIQWGDLALSFTSVAGRDQLWSWSVGDEAATAQLVGIPGGLPRSAPSGLRSRPPDRVGIGTTLGEIRSWHTSAHDSALSFAAVTLNGSKDQRVPADDEATSGVLRVGLNTIEMRLDHGTITWISMRDPSLC